MNANAYLKVVRGSERRRTISGTPSFSVLLSGSSPVTGIGERVTVVTRQLPDKHVIYMLLVAQEKDYAMLAPSSDRMVRSLKVSSSAAHL
jgi:hypothetical protein